MAEVVVGRRKTKTDPKPTISLRSPRKENITECKLDFGLTPSYLSIKCKIISHAMGNSEGDKWDARVKEAEKVVEGLQNTLALMMGTNEAFKESLKPASANSTT